jgi:hypothetical protein
MRALIMIVVFGPLTVLAGLVLYPVYGSTVYVVLGAGAVAGIGWQAYFDERAKVRRLLNDGRLNSETASHNR